MKKRNEKIQQRLYEGIFIIVAAIGLFLALALFTYNPNDPSWSHITAQRDVTNFAGYLGAFLADLLLCGFGYLAYALPFLFIYAAWLPCAIKKNGQGDQLVFAFIMRASSFLLFLLSASSLIEINIPGGNLPSGSGGIIGSLFSVSLLHFLNLATANLLLLALFLSSTTLFTGISWIKTAEFLGRFILKLIDFCGRQAMRIDIKGFFKYSDRISMERKIKLSRFEPDSDLDDIAPTLRVKYEPIDPLSLAPIVPAKSESKPLLIASQQSIKPSRRAEQEKQINLFEVDLEGSLPPLSLLDTPNRPAAQVYSHEELERISRDVELRLQDFGVEVKVVAVHPGPVVTRFELQPRAGTKVSRITALAKDLARSLSVTSVRIVEVIPGKSVIGLELPNVNREIVRLREILSSQQYEAARAPLTIALGKDISGHPVIVDLAKMPHLLVAGTTGSGKSVCLNAILLSLLYKYSPKNVRMILIDPKMLELSIYDGIPHLLAPVVTDMKDATNALRWCVFEMERRYKLLAALGVRNLSGYNHKIKEARDKGASLTDPLLQKNGSEEKLQALKELPFIVVIADEYADMIMVVGKKVEELIARIAQKARAAGIHLILATQRPSVDVITGLIKANISTRIAFQVSSKIDSRTILDQGGAEQLLGFGDMLYLPPGSGVPIRVHGAFVADDEVHRVVKDLKRRAGPEYLEGILSYNNGGDGDSANAANNSFAEALGVEFTGDNFSDVEQDPLYDQAVQIVLETRRASISQIQRRLRIGYNRAARMVEEMEKAGLVGPMEANGNREVLVPAVGTE